MILAGALLVIACSVIGSWVSLKRNTRKSLITGIACNAALLTLIVAWTVYAVANGLEG